jgi:two-component system LytT family sensor kinase
MLRPSVTPRLIAAALALPAASGALMFVYRFGDVLARGDGDAPLSIFVEEMTGAYASLPSLAVFWFAVMRWPITRADWLRRTALYLGLIVLLGALATMLMWISRTLLFPALGLGGYDYGNLWWRVPMELGLQVLFYSMVIGLFHFARSYRETRAAKLRAAELEAALARSQLDAIEARLEPHFIFNTLNTISAVMHEDLAEADRLLGRLGDLLRRAMTRDAPATVPLQDEIAWLEAYLALMQRRFGPRLTVAVATDTAANQVPVPRFLLQPLVENAIRHGVASKAGPGRVEVSVKSDGARLHVEVRDDGNGLGSSTQRGSGVGLADTSSRLALLYGDRHRFEVISGPEGGTVARIELPLPEG